MATSSSVRESDDRLAKRGDAPAAVDRAQAAAALVESLEVQLALVLLLALDVSCAALALLVEPVAPLAALLEALAGFALVAFVLELALLLAAFRGRFFAHAGYALDAAVVATAIAYELYAHSKALRLLGVLRLWRVVRVVSTLVERERRAHDATRDALEREQLKVLQLDAEKLAAQESLRREYESRGGLEKLLQSYKDEVETLKEALQIAAEAVAEADLRAGASSQLMPVSEEDAALAPAAAAADAVPLETESSWETPATDYDAYDGYTYALQAETEDEEAALVFAEASQGASEPLLESDSSNHSAETEAEVDELTTIRNPPVKALERGDRDVDTEEQRAAEAATDEFQDAIEDPFQT